MAAYTLQTFLEKIKPLVIADMAESGILASLTASQAIIESNKGNSGLTQKCNNLFGIKGKYKGQSGKFLTTEYYNGKATKVYADFRKYPSWQDSISDHSALFNRMSRYSNLRNCQDYEEACVNVKKDGYATSPTYTQTLMKPIKSHSLWKWDYEVLKKYPASKLRTIKQGADGAGVYLLQLLLTENGYDSGKCDSAFGGKTASCLIQYQKDHDLTADGICGQKTWAKLKA